MKARMVRVPMMASLLLAALCAGAQAQQIFSGEDITEEKLIQALTPGQPGVRTRSIQVQRDEKPAAKPAASLLITFVTNSAELTPDAQAKLDVVGRALKADRLARFSFSVEGHADPRGLHEHNLRLSQLRAENVVDYLATRHLIERDRLKPVGKGDAEPVNTVEPAAPENRRVTIVTIRE